MSDDVTDIKQTIFLTEKAVKEFCNCFYKQWANYDPVRRPLT